MSELLKAHTALLESARPADDLPRPRPPGEALARLVEFADRGAVLSTDVEQKWELEPHVCRQLEDELGPIPSGGWSRVVSLAAGAGVLYVTGDAFVPVAGPQWIADHEDGFCRRMVEAFTCRLIPPAAAAVLYASLDVKLIWGLEMGRAVGSSEPAAPAVTAPGESGLPIVQELIFGTLTGLVTALRCTDVDARYPVDALGNVLWAAACAASDDSGALTARPGGLPVFGDHGMVARRAMITRPAISDLLDLVFVPAGVVRRDDSGWFVVNPQALADVQIGHWSIAEQIAWWNKAITGRLAAC